MNPVSLVIPQSGNNINRYTSRLANIWRSRQWLDDPDFARLNDYEAWEKFNRDPVIKQAIQMRLHGVAGNSFTMEPASDEEVDVQAAAWVTWLFGHIRGFSTARQHAAKAVLRGQSWQFTKGARRVARWDKTAPQEFWIPTGFEHIDERRMRWVPIFKNLVTGEESKGSAHEGDPEWQPRRVLEIGSVKISTLWKRVHDLSWFFHVDYDDEESRLGYGRGILEACWFYHYAKGQLLEDMLQLSKRLGQGLPILGIDREGIKAGNPDRTNDDVVAAALDALRNMQAEGGFVKDKMDELEVLFPDASGWQMFEAQIGMLDDAVTRLILGSNLPSGGGGETGSLARAEVEQETTETLIQYDRQIQAEAITDQVVRLVWNLNTEQRQAIGLGEARMPSYSPVQERREDPMKAAEQAKVMLDSGVSLSKTEYYERTGWRMPADDEEVIEPQQPDPMGMDGFGGSRLPAANRN